MLLKLATFGTLGYAGYWLYEKTRGESRVAPASARASRGSAVGPGPLREGADTDGAGSGGMVDA